MNSQIVDKFFQHMGNGEIDDALSLLSEDTVHHDMGTGMVLKGLEENRADMEN